MTQNEFKKILKVNAINIKLKNILDFINSNNIDISDYNGQISSDRLLTFISKMYSIEKTVQILCCGNDAIYRAINIKPIQTAQFYNIYSLDFVPPITNISVILSQEYLELVPIEWTEKYIFKNTQFYLKKHGKGYRVINDEDDYFSIRDNFINIFDENISSLENAIKNSTLDKAIKKLSDTAI